MRMSCRGSGSQPGWPGAASRSRRLAAFRLARAAACLALALALAASLTGACLTGASAEDRNTGLKPVSIGFVRHAYGTWTAKIADGSFEMATGRTLRWQPYDTDSAIAAAMAGGRLDIGLIGSSVAAAAYARGLDLKIFFVMGGSAESEGMVLHGDFAFRVGDPKSLSSKVVAVPFGSTPHFRLLQSLRRWGTTVGSVRLVNLQTPQIAEAWHRGELDAAVVSEPLLGRLKQTGRLVPLSGGGSYDGLMVLAGVAEFVAENVVFLARFVDIITRADTAFAQMSGPLNEARADVRSISFLTGLQPAEVIAAIARYRPPRLEEQATAHWLGGGAAATLAAELKANAEVWRWGGRFDRAEPDFAPAITVEPVARALEFQR